MHVFHPPKILILLCSLALVACISPPPEAQTQTDMDPPNNVITTNNSTVGDMDTDTEIPDSCGDGVLNQDETDVDCGGSLCVRCDLGKTCSQSADCVSEQCEGTCVPRPDCTVGEDLTLDQAYANPACTYIAIATAGPHTLSPPITRDLILEGVGDSVELGALKVEGGNVTVTNVDFKNQTNSTGAIQHIGGTLEIQDVRFSNCKGEQGGAIWTTGTLSVVDSVFKSNTALEGGAIYAGPASSLTIKGSQFKDNRSSRGGFEGGAIRIEGGTLAISDSIFIGNEAKSESPNTGIARGGAIFARSTTMSIKSTAFESNQTISPTEAIGGAVWVRGGTVDILDTVFKNNSASAPLASGGAFSQNNSNTTIRRSAFVENSLLICTTGCAGGAVRAIATNSESPSLDFENVTFSGNTFAIQSEGLGNGTALYTVEHHVRLYSVTFKGNEIDDNKNAESVHLRGKSKYLDNTLFADQREPFLGTNVIPTGQNISLYAVTEGSPLTVNSGLTLQNLVFENQTYVHPFSIIPPTAACKNLAGQPLTEDQAKNPRSDSCAVGAYDPGATP